MKRNVRMVCGVCVVVVVIAAAVAFFMYSSSEEGSLQGRVVDASGVGSGSGFVGVVYQDGRYVLSASLTGLVEQDEDEFFYEGWILRPDPLGRVSVGMAQRKSDGSYKINFVSEENLLDYTVFVLTLESNDGNDAPSQTLILEGVLS